MPSREVTHPINHVVDVVTEPLQYGAGLGIAALAEAVGSEAEPDRSAADAAERRREGLGRYCSRSASPAASASRVVRRRHDGTKA